MKNNIEEFRVKRIVNKYGGGFSDVITRADEKEMAVILNYVARKANEKQKEVVSGVNIVTSNAHAMA